MFIDTTVRDIVAEVPAFMRVFKQIEMDRRSDGKEPLPDDCKYSSPYGNEIPGSLERTGVLETQRALPVDGNRQAPANILVVMSESDVRGAVCRILDEARLKAFCVSTVHEARDALLHKPVRLVICAPQLTDGTFRELLSARPAVPAQMVIVCSGGCSAGRRIDILEMGILDYVSYPILREELIWVVRGALVKSSSDEARPMAQ